MNFAGQDEETEREGSQGTRLYKRHTWGGVLHLLEITRHCHQVLDLFVRIETLVEYISTFTRQASFYVKSVAPCMPETGLPSTQNIVGIFRRVKIGM